MKGEVSKRDWGDVLLVVNPISGAGRALRHLGEVCERLRRQLNVSVVQTVGPGDAMRAARDFGKRQGVILAFGGDGTFNEVLNGADLSTCTLGMIPAGAGNVLAKEVGLSWDPPRAVEQVLSGRRTRLDVGMCNGRRFACVFGAGFDAAVVERVVAKRTGAMTQRHYVPALLRAVLRPENWDMEVRVDGALFGKHLNMAVVGNTHSYGGPIELTPCASPRDGLLDVAATHVNGPADFLDRGPAILMRKLHLPRTVRYHRGKHLRITSARKDVPCQMDGEFAGYLPADIRCVPRAFHLLVPSSFTPQKAFGL